MYGVKFGSVIFSMICGEIGHLPAEGCFVIDFFNAVLSCISVLVFTDRGMRTDLVCLRVKKFFFKSLFERSISFFVTSKLCMKSITWLVKLAYENDFTS